MLKKDTTIADVLPILQSPEAYLKGVMQKMLSCIDLHGDAKVVIGIDGTGKFPCYRILYSRPLKDGSFEELIANSFIDSHKPFQSGYGFVQSDSWSEKALSFEDVRALLSKVTTSRV